MSNHRNRILTNATIIVIAFGAGICGGLLVYPEVFDIPAVEEAAEDDHEAHEEHLGLTKEVVQNLDLKIEKIKLSDYWQHQSFPGDVIEIPGKSDLSVSAPVTGVVENVAIRSGQSVRSNEVLFELRITDSALTSAQANLLDLISQLDVAQKDIERLRPLVAQGTAASKNRELEYQILKLNASKQTQVQEILARGLPRSILDDVVATKQLATRVSIRVPRFKPAPLKPDDLTKAVSLAKGTDPVSDFSVKQIAVHPGLSVEAGGKLCDLANHSELYIRGQAFEAELPAIVKLNAEDWPVVAEFGHQHGNGHQHLELREGLQVTHISNHVDSETQTFAFFMPLKNEVLQETLNEDRLYRQWRFRPGQRVHLRVPVQKIESAISLPVEAVAFEGPSATVFRKPKHDMTDNHDHSAHAYLELEAVEVHVLHRDHHSVSVATDGELKVGDRVAMNRAYQLQLAMRSGSADPHAHHDHDH